MARWFNIQIKTEWHLLNLLSNFLRKRKQRVVLDKQTSSWADDNAVAPQGSILDPRLFLIYIKDLVDGLSLNAKLFADGISFVFDAHNVNTSKDELSNDLVKINKWTSQWKTSFNPDPNKQAQKVILCRKINKEDHPPLLLNNNNVSEVNSQNHLYIVLDNRLSFDEH